MDKTRPVSGRDKERSISNNNSNNNADAIGSVQDITLKNRELMDETGRLRKLLSERELELKILRRRVEDERSVNASGSAGASDAAAAKIVEMSKKARELTAELQKEKVRAQCAEKKLQETQNLQIIQEERKIDGMKLVDTSRKQVSEADEMKSLQEKLRVAESRAAECRSQLEAVRAELRLTQKVLSQEVGEGVQIQKLIGDNTGGWKGRAQQIASLQRKVTELKKLVDQQNKPTSAGLNDEMWRGLGDLMTRSHQLYEETDPVVGSVGHRVGPEGNERGKEEIRRIERQRKDNAERMAMNLKNLEQQYDDLKQKSEAMKARNKTLSEELKMFRGQVATLREKGQHDDELISALLKQHAELKQALEAGSKKTNSNVNNKSTVSAAAVTGRQKDREDFEQLKNIKVEKEAQIKNEVQDRIKTYEVAGRASSECSSVTSDMSCVDQTVSRIVDDLLAPSSTPLFKQSNTEKMLPSDHEAELSTDEVRVQYMELLVLYQAATVERDRFSEFNKVLQTRIEEMTLRLVESQSATQEQRRRNALLEKQAEGLKLNPSNHTVKKKDSSVGRDSDPSLTAQVLQDLQLKLDIKSDDNLALRAALQSTLKAKEDDLKYFMNLIFENKQVFQQSLKHFRDHFTND